MLPSRTTPFVVVPRLRRVAGFARHHPKSRQRELVEVPWARVAYR
jgi:hypothetical protein